MLLEEILKSRLALRLPDPPECAGESPSKLQQLIDCVGFAISRALSFGRFGEQQGLNSLKNITGPYGSRK